VAVLEERGNKANCSQVAHENFRHLQIVESAQSKIDIPKSTDRREETKEKETKRSRLGWNSHNQTGRTRKQYLNGVRQ
jgi:hypothetical protein